MPYLVCGECGNYYQLQEGESPEDFLLSCTCGGRLILVESLDETELFENQEEQYSHRKPVNPEHSGNVSNQEELGGAFNPEELKDRYNLEESPEHVQNLSTTKFFKISIILAIFGILIISASILNHDDSYGAVSSNEYEKYSQEQSNCFLETTFSPIIMVVAMIG